MEPKRIQGKSLSSALNDLVQRTEEHSEDPMQLFNSIGEIDLDLDDVMNVDSVPNTNFEDDADDHETQPPSEEQDGGSISRRTRGKNKNTAVGRLQAGKKMTLHFNPDPFVAVEDDINNYRKQGLFQANKLWDRWRCQWNTLYVKAREGNEVAIRANPPPEIELSDWHYLLDRRFLTLEFKGHGRVVGMGSSVTPTCFRADARGGSSIPRSDTQHFREENRVLLEEMQRMREEHEAEKIQSQREREEALLERQMERQMEREEAQRQREMEREELLMQRDKLLKQREMEREEARRNRQQSVVERDRMQDEMLEMRETMNFLLSMVPGGRPLRPPAPPPPLEMMPLPLDRRFPVYSG
ncbi:uncharacterized protein LOC124913187 [Impatiens glandulifera]|uniref:uncharacterized protein LOC124913187 n=1 Tax=Impatiens glandulifera TaxID=253017 RepID=UPI001FB0D392|nr:uncharacterized protein LOC124913187 [Impatiens glandulifera]